MVVKLSRKCGCKRKTRNKQTKRGKTMKGGSRGSSPGHSGSVRRAPPAYMQPPAYNTGTLKRKGSIQEAAEKPIVRGNVSVRNLISRFESLPQQKIAFTSTVMGPVSVPDYYYSPQNN